MSAWFLARLRAAIAAAATLTGKRFGLLVASSVVATSAIVAAGATSQPEASPIASILGRSLAADRTAAPAPSPAPIEPAIEEEAPVEEIGPEPEAIQEETVVPEETFTPEETAPVVEPEPVPEEEAPVEEEPEPAPAPAPAPPEAGRIKHVFLVSLQSPGYQAAFGQSSQMPYLSGTLVKKGLLLSNFSVLDKATTPNGIAAISGQPPNSSTKGECPAFTEFTAPTVSKTGIVTGEGCVYPVETLTFGDQLETGGFTWRAYMEGMVSPTTAEPENCVHPGPEEEETGEQLAAGGYSARLNPFTHFHSLLDLGACASNDAPITELKKDLKSEAKTANFSYISPDLCSAGVAGQQCPEGAPTGAAAADEWLAQVVPEILESPAYKKDGLLIVTFGGINPPEPVEGEAPKAEANPLKTGAVLLSKFVAVGSTDAAPYNPYALLRTDEELFGFGQLAKAGDAKTRTLAPALLGENGGD